MKTPNWIIWLNDKKECEVWFKEYVKKGIIIKRKDESKLHLKKADHNLMLAEWILQKHKTELKEIFKNETFYDWIITMHYYAVYHAALALICKENYYSKNHHATLCFLIQNHFHKTKKIDEKDVEFISYILEKEDIKTIGLTKEMRERASYDVHESFEQKIANQIKEQTLTFITKVKFLIEN